MIPVVYTMGKVGSTAISRAIKQVGVKCYDVHTLNENIIKNLRPMTWHDEAREINRTVRLAPERAVYISVVREPVSRNISAFFENRSTYSLREDTTAEETVDSFVSQYHHRIPIEWADRELRDQLGVDIYSQPFDKTRKVQIWEGPPKVILFRVDTPDDLKSAVISDAIGAKVSVGRANTSADKDYAAAYSTFKEQIALPPSYLDTMYGSQFSRHFWTYDELDELWNGWLRAPSASFGCRRLQTL